MRRAAVVFVIALAVYAITMCRTVGPTDSGELTLAAQTLGVAHPPGFPLYVLVTHLFTMISLGDVAVRANVASAFFAALAAAAMTFIADDAVIAIAAGLFLAFSRTLWSYATVAEVYALNTFLSVAMLVLAMRWRRTRDVRFLRLASLAFGLALGVHYVTAGIVAIGAAILAGRVRLRDVVPFVFAGLLVYAYLPLTASRDPAMNWGNPTTVQRFIDHVSAKQYRQYVGGHQDFSRIGDIAVHEFPLVAIAGVIGVALIFRRDRRLFIALIAIVAVNCAWVIVYPIKNDTDAYLIPIFIALIVGATVILSPRSAAKDPSTTRDTGPSASSRLRMTAITIAICTFITSYQNHANDTLARDRVEAVIAQAPRNATIISGDWELISPMLLLHPERHVVQTGLLIRTWYLDQLARREHLDVSALRPWVAEWERDGTAQQAVVLELNRFFFRLVTTRKVYVTRDVVSTPQLRPAFQELQRRGFIH
jgi:hypothetical protein